MALLGIKKAIENTNGMFREVSIDENGKISYSPIETKRVSLRTVQGQYKEKDTEVSSVSNLQNQESGFLSFNSSILSLKYSIKFHKMLAISISDQEEDLFIEKVNEQFNNNENIRTVSGMLTSGYLYQIISGKVGWRNAENSLETKTVISVTYPIKKKFVFEDCNLLPEYGVESNLELITQEESFIELSQLIGSAIFRNKKLVIEVEHFYELGMKGAEVYPSQLILNAQEQKDSRPVSEGGKSGPSKKLYEIKDLNNSTLALTSQKIANMIRKIDFHTNAGKNISFETYGVDLSTSTAWRIKKDDQGGKDSFYKLKARVMKSEILSEEELYYFVGVLIRGGLLESGKKKPKANKKDTKTEDTKE